ncbi:MAG: hypothetical protein DMF98_10405 [Acidobacteria bacterium]|nr:MAG: hypothetical protein DMF98_10405 [Acidobacteriota bacterium]
MFGRKRHHRERVRTIGIDHLRRAKAILPHQCGEPRQQRRQLLCRGMRSREQGVLQDSSRRGIDDDGDPIDGAARRMRFEIQQRQRPERPHIAHRRRQLEPPRVRLARNEPQDDVQHRRAAIATLEPRRQRFEQPREDERQRLEPVDWPFEIERRFEPLVFERRHERPNIFAARDGLPDERVTSKPRRQIRLWQCRELAERFHPPPFECRLIGGPGQPGPDPVDIHDGLQDPDRDGRQRGGLITRRRNGDTRTRVRQDERRHPGGGDGNVNTDAARHRRATQLFADHAGGIQTATEDTRDAEGQSCGETGMIRAASQHPFEAADVNRHEMIVMALVPRRELPRDRH